MLLCIMRKSCNLRHEINAYNEALKMALTFDDLDTAEQLRDSLLEEQHAEKKVAALQAVNDGGPDHQASHQSHAWRAYPAQYSIWQKSGGRGARRSVLNQCTSDKYSRLPAFI